uniref:Uncharacterized protein n=1 Tax=Setaria italica TaxID=4555 RepID=K3Y435_SETIT
MHYCKSECINTVLFLYGSLYPYFIFVLLVIITMLHCLLGTNAKSSWGTHSSVICEPILVL